MPYTNKTTIQHRKRIIDLTKLSKNELVSLRTQMYFDLADIENQINWAKAKYKKEGIEYSHQWMERAIKAAKIKQDDIPKIQDVIDSMPDEQTAVEDIIMLKGLVRKFIVNRAITKELEHAIQHLDHVYGNQLGVADD